MLKLALFAALAYLVHSLLRHTGLTGRGPASRKTPPTSSRIDRSRVVDAEYRETDAGGEES